MSSTATTGEAMADTSFSCSKTVASWSCVADLLQRPVLLQLSVTEDLHENVLALVATATLVLLALAAMAILVLAAWRVRARRPAWQKRLRARISSPFLRTPRVRKRRLKSVRVAWSQLDQDAASEMGCEVAETPSRHPGDVHDL